MHGQHREDRQQKWHMWPGPSRRAHNGTEADSDCVNYFFKAGRKIGVGDCAFFRADNAPLFIGIIRKLSAEEEGNLKLSVNLLYRLGDINLGKGASLEAAPNEIFYSFHKDEISAASLLHPCKVAFLQKGVELPSSVSSFVCRRVYDTANKCLYWLTDQDYTDEHQAEVDQLLGRTRHEMQAAAPSEGPSQRATRSPSPLKPETAANAPFSTQGKGKKRPRTDQNQDTSKREKLVKAEDSDSKRDCALKYEDFAYVADKHKGITNMFSTEQLFQVMLQERNDSVRKLVDVMSRRASLASIIAATEKEECLTHFVQLGGLRILNDWLQEAHEGKLGDVSPKEGDTALEEFLLTLIRALEKLPVDLDALKTCIVGKSVNKLRSHRNSEIQKKARKLVDMWKKRVNAEISSDEVKSGANTATTWSSRPTDIQNRGPTETQNPKVQSAKSSAFVKPAMNGSNLVGDTKVNIQPASAYKVHSGMALPKEKSMKSHMGVTHDILSIVKEEKSCSSGQSQNNSQSWCSGSGKGIGSVKEEVKTLSVAQGRGDNNSQSWCSGSGKGVGSVKEEVKPLSVAPVSSKPTGAMLRNHGHSLKSHSTVTLTSLKKDFVGRHKTPGVERIGSASFLEKGASDGARVENPNSQRLIVRLPNPGRSPSHSVSAGSLADGSAINNKGSPPASMGRHDHVSESRTAPAHSPDTSGDAKSVKCNGNGTSRTNIKEEVDRSCGVKIEEAVCKPMSFEHRPKDLVGKCPSDAQEAMAKKAPSSSNTSPARLVLDSVEGGINLLATVAAREVFESEKSFSGSTAGEGQPISADSAIQSESMHQKGGKDDEKQKQGAPATACPPEPSADCQKDSGPEDMEQLADCPKIESRNLNEEKASEDRATLIETESVSLGSPIAIEGISSKAPDSEAVGCEAPTLGNCGGDDILIASDVKKNVSNGGPSTAECQTVSPSSPHHTTSLETDCKDVERTTLGPASLASAPSSCPNAGDSLACYEEDALEVARQVAKEVEQEVERYEAQDGNLTSACSDISRCEKVVEHAKPNQMLSGDAMANGKDSKSMDAAQASASTGTFTESVEAPDKGKCLSGKVTEVDQVSHNDEGKVRQHLEAAIESMDVAKDHKENVPLIGAKEEPVTTIDIVMAEPSLSEDNVGGSKEVERPVFDLNEGLIADDILQASATHTIVSAPIPALSSPDPPSGVALQASSLAAPIAVVAASKGAFIPPSNLTKTKGELGWKGSAATSAFRPAEPRRVAETSHLPLDVAAATCGSMDVSGQSEKQARFLDIDLNVADERSIEDACAVARPPAVPLDEAPIASSGPGASRPELDLNRLDGNDESMGHMTSIPRDAVVAPARSSVLPQTAPRVMLDFDLNDGLGFEESVAEEVSSHHSNPESSGMPITGRMRQNPDLVNVAPWYSASSFMPAAMVIPAFPAGRSESSYPVVAAPGSKPVMTMGHNSCPFSSDLYRGAAISSSPVSYSASMPASFSYAGFPFGGGFPYTSASYNMGSTPHIAATSAPPFLTANASQLVSAGAVGSPYGRPYPMGGIRDMVGADCSAPWTRPSLDLNSGPDVGADLDARDTRPNIGLSQLSYQQAGSLGGTLKRKEPEGSYDPFRSGFKQMAWR